MYQDCAAAAPTPTTFGAAPTQRHTEARDCTEGKSASLPAPLEGIPLLSGRSSSGKRKLYQTICSLFFPPLQGGY